MSVGKQKRLCGRCRSPLMVGKKACGQCGLVVKQGRLPRRRQPPARRKKGTPVRTTASTIAPSPGKKNSNVRPMPSWAEILRTPELRQRVIAAMFKSLLSTAGWSAMVIIPGVLLTGVSKLLGILWLFAGAFLLMFRTYAKPWRLMTLTCLTPALAAMVSFLIQYGLFNRLAPSGPIALVVISVGAMTGVVRARAHDLYVEDGSIMARRTLLYLSVWAVTYVITQMLGAMGAAEPLIYGGLLTSTFSASMLSTVSLVILVRFRTMASAAAAVSLACLLSAGDVQAQSGASEPYPDQYIGKLLLNADVSYPDFGMKRDGIEGSRNNNGSSNAVFAFRPATNQRYDQMTSYLKVVLGVNKFDNVSVRQNHLVRRHDGLKGYLQTKIGTFDAVYKTYVNMNSISGMPVSETTLLILDGDRLVRVQVTENRRAGFDRDNSTRLAFAYGHIVMSRLSAALTNVPRVEDTQAGNPGASTSVYVPPTNESGTSAEWGTVPVPELDDIVTVSLITSLILIGLAGGANLSQAIASAVATAAQVGIEVTTEQATNATIDALAEQPEPRPDRNTAATPPPRPLFDSKGDRIPREGDQYRWGDRLVTRDEAIRLSEEERQAELEQQRRLNRHRAQADADWDTYRNRSRAEADAENKGSQEQQEETRRRTLAALQAAQRWINNRTGKSSDPWLPRRIYDEYFGENLGAIPTEAGSEDDKRRLSELLERYERGQVSSSELAAAMGLAEEFIRDGQLGSIIYASTERGAAQRAELLATEAQIVAEIGKTAATGAAGGGRAATAGMNFVYTTIQNAEKGAGRAMGMGLVNAGFGFVNQATGLDKVGGKLPLGQRMVVQGAISGAQNVAEDAANHRVEHGSLDRYGRQNVAISFGMGTIGGSMGAVMDGGPDVPDAAVPTLRDAAADAPTVRVSAGPDAPTARTVDVEAPAARSVGPDMPSGRSHSADTVGTRAAGEPPATTGQAVGSNVPPGRPVEVEPAATHSGLGKGAGEVDSSTQMTPAGNVDGASSQPLGTQASGDSPPVRTPSRQDPLADGVDPTRTPRGSDDGVDPAPVRRQDTDAGESGPPTRPTETHDPESPASPRRAGDDDMDGISEPRREGDGEAGPRGRELDSTGAADVDGGSASSDQLDSSRPALEPDQVGDPAELEPGKWHSEPGSDEVRIVNQTTGEVEVHQLAPGKGKRVPGTTNVVWRNLETGEIEIHSRTVPLGPDETRLPPPVATGEDAGIRNTPAGDEIAPEHRPQSGWTEPQVDEINKIMDGEDAILVARPTNMSSRQQVLDGAEPKPEWIKSKTITVADTYLGKVSSKDVGLAGFFRPLEPDYSKIPVNLQAEVRARYQFRLDEYNKHLSEYQSLVISGKMVMKDGKLLKVTGGKGVPFAGDIDPVAILDRKTRRPIIGERYQRILGRLKNDSGMQRVGAIQHGAEVNILADVMSRYKPGTPEYDAKLASYLGLHESLANNHSSYRDFTIELDGRSMRRGESLTHLPMQLPDE